jgi:parallel beta-helix repeat protein
MAALHVSVSRIGCALVLAPFLFAGPSGAATVTVCPSGCDQVTIQAAATAADPGDTIQILSGLPHTEGNISLTKNLTIEGLGASTTIIQADATAGAATVPVFVVTNGANVTMRDLSVRYGVGSDGGGVAVLDGAVTLEDVAVTSNAATGSGGGIWVAAAGSLETIRATIEDNGSESKGGGVAAEGPVEMTDTVLMNNWANRSSGDVFGGGIWSAGNLTMHSCRWDSNNVDAPGPESDGFGGGISFHGPNLLIEDSLIKANSIHADRSEFGGSVYLTGTGVATLRRNTIRSSTAKEGAGIYSTIETLTVEDCTISDNIAGDLGGGMLLSPPGSGVTRVLSSTIVGNEAEEGGGLYLSAPARILITNSTISGNIAADNGGGIYALSTGFEIANSTVTDNTADEDTDGFGDGGGIFINSGESAELRNSIVADNHDSSSSPQAPDCAGTLQSGGYNLIGSLGVPLAVCTIVGDSTGNLVGADPLLDVLADNYGPTETHALGPGSAAINAGDPAGCRDPDGVLLDADQRHALRLDRCDMGAFEVGAYFEPFFADGFESGSTSAWSLSVP